MTLLILLFSLGQQAVRHSIAFKKLTIAEPDELWGIDQNGTTYKYFVGEWIPLPGERIREIHAGRSGVLIVSLNNSLYRREGISASKPQGEAWNLIRLNGMVILKTISKLFDHFIFGLSLTVCV